MRSACAECGIGVPVEDLILVARRELCPRCYALTTPATLVPSGAWAGAPAGTSGGGGSAPGPPPEADDHDGAAAAPPRGPLRRLDASVRAWAAGRHWWIRAPLLVWLTWILLRYWDAPWYTTVFAGIDLAFHEIGHYLWAPLGEFMAAAGGTLTQCLIPVAAGAVLYRQRDWFGVAVAVCWLGINCFEVVQYAGDAVARRLPLVSPASGEPIHDWWFMLSRLGILHLHERVATGWLWAGRAVMTVGILFGARVLWVMAWSAKPDAGSPEPARAPVEAG